MPRDMVLVKTPSHAPMPGVLAPMIPAVTLIAALTSSITRLATKLV